MGEIIETVIDSLSLGSKITTDGDYSHEIKRHLLLGRGAMKKKENSYVKPAAAAAAKSLQLCPNLASVFKSRDITLLTKICIVKAIVFPGVMCRYEIWTIKKDKH